MDKFCEVRCTLLRCIKPLWNCFALSFWQVTIKCRGKPHHRYFCEPLKCGWCIPKSKRHNSRLVNKYHFLSQMWFWWKRGISCHLTLLKTQVGKTLGLSKGRISLFVAVTVCIFWAKYFNATELKTIRLASVNNHSLYGLLLLFADEK